MVLYQAHLAADLVEQHVTTPKYCQVRPDLLREELNWVLQGGWVLQMELFLELATHVSACFSTSPSQVHPGALQAWVKNQARLAALAQ